MPKKSSNPTPVNRAGWPVRLWEAEAGIGHTKTAELIKANQIESVKFGNKRIILTPPAAFLASLKQQAA